MYLFEPVLACLGRDQVQRSAGPPSAIDHHYEAHSQSELGLAKANVAAELEAALLRHDLEQTVVLKRVLRERSHQLARAEKYKAARRTYTFGPSSTGHINSIKFRAGFVARRLRAGVVALRYRRSHLLASPCSIMFQQTGPSAKNSKKRPVLARNAHGHCYSRVQYCRQRTSSCKGSYPDQLWRRHWAS